MTPKSPSTIDAEDVQALPPSTAPGEAPEIPPYGSWDVEEVKRRFPGLSEDEAHRITNRLNGRDAEAIELGSEDLLPVTESLGPEDIESIPPTTDVNTDPEYTPREPSALNPEDYEQLASSIDDDARALPPSTDPEYTPKRPSELASEDYEQIPESIQSEDVRALPPDTEPQTRRSMSPDEVSTQRSITPEDDTPLARMAGSVSDEAKPSAGEAATRASQWIDAAFAGGDAPSKSARAKMIASSVAHQLGRALTSDEAKDIAKFMASTAVGGAVGDALDDGEGGGAALGAAVGGMVGGGHPGGPRGKLPRQLEASGPKGESLKGFSALRRQQHLALEKLQEAGAGLGANSDKSVLRKVLGFNQNSGTPEDAILLEEARKLGLEEELWRAPATQAYGRLRERGMGGAPDKVNGGIRSILSRIFGPRIDAASGVLAGEPTTFQGKQGPLETGTRELLNLSGGRLGARFGDETNFAKDYLNQLLFAPPVDKDNQRQREGKK